MGQRSRAPVLILVLVSSCTADDRSFDDRAAGGAGQGGEASGSQAASSGGTSSTSSAGGGTGGGGESCGDTRCSDGETCDTCARDCGQCPPHCGDGECGMFEDCANCAVDCACACVHDKCVVGEALEATCDPCVETICSQSPACCSSGWSFSCVELVAACVGGACPMGQCGHDECVIGVALWPGCSPCVEMICAFDIDPYCCDTRWDDACVGEVDTVCGTPCP